MKAAWAVAAAALISVPILALPAGPTVGSAAVETHAQTISELGAKGDHMITGCPQGRSGASLSVERFEFGKGLSIRAEQAMPCRVEYRTG